MHVVFITGQSKQKRSSPLEAPRPGRARIYTYGQSNGYFHIPGTKKRGIMCHDVTMCLL